MTRILTRAAVVAAAVVLGAATLGCGFIANVGNAVDNLAAVGDLTDKLTRSANLTFTARYSLVDASGTATVVQEPPRAAYTGADGTFILTAEALYMCTTNVPATCQRAPNSMEGKAPVDYAAYATAVAGGGFISAPMAITMIGAASIVPGVEIETSAREIAGLDGTCLRATGISSPEQAGAGNTELTELTVCVADNGVLTAFSGTGTDGSRVGVELTNYSATVDPAAFAPPAGAKVVDVPALSA
jgi:hypothetical protein